MSVSLQELKNHLRIFGDDENSSLKIYLESAIDYISTITARKLKRGDEASYFSAFSSNMRLKGEAPGNIVVNYLDIDGNTQVLDSSVYRLNTHAPHPYLSLAPNQAWPELYSADSPVTVNYESGYDDDSLPDSLKSAVLIHAATAYEYREDETMTNGRSRKAIERLIERYTICDL